MRPAKAPVHEPLLPPRCSQSRVGRTRNEVESHLCPKRNTAPRFGHLQVRIVRRESWNAVAGEQQRSQDVCLTHEVDQQVLGKIPVISKVSRGRVENIGPANYAALNIEPIRIARDVIIRTDAGTVELWKLPG